MKIRPNKQDCDVINIFEFLECGWYVERILEQEKLLLNQTKWQKMNSRML